MIIKYSNNFEFFTMDIFVLWTGNNDIPKIEYIGIKYWKKKTNRKRYHKYREYKWYHNKSMI